MTQPAPLLAPVTFGMVIRIQDSSGLRITHLIHRAHTRLARHQHEDPTIMIVLSGAVEERVGRRSFVCGPGSLLIKPAATPHANRYGRTPVECVVIQLGATSALAERYGRVFGRVSHLPNARPMFSCTGSPEDDVTRLLHRLDQCLGSVRRSIAIDGSLCTIRARLLGDPAARVPLHDLARSAGLSPSALSHAFRLRYGCTPSGFRRRQRLERAVALCAEPGLTLSTVAARAGFADQAHFTRQFKALMGTTPGRFKSVQA